MDKEGIETSKGSINEDLLNKLMLHDFVNKKPPKSTGRHEFGIKIVHQTIKKYPKMNIQDLLRTFCMFTAKSIAINLEKYLNINSLKTRLIISGGGIHHPLLIQEFKKISNITNIINIKDYNLHEDNKEAFLMAVLATARIQQLSSNIQTVTGAIEDVILGDIWEQ